MADLPNGYTTKTKAYKTVKVLQKLGEGGQGAVYKVDYNGHLKALKWYSGMKLEYPEKFIANLENNIKNGAPTKSFLWPEDITEMSGDAFGYIMDLFPPEYEDFSKLLRGKARFAGGYTAMLNTALHITAGFRELHNAGYSYQDLNDGNFRFNPTTGDVLICDNDNVAAKPTGIAGKARYMAPEIVARRATPNRYTDSFSLAVILFMLFTRNHPLEGKKWASVPCLSAKYEKKLYGEEPVFIFDPTDTSNQPVPGLHKGAINNWPSLPLYIQDAFTKSFSKKAMTDPNERLIERDWLRLFIRMRSEIFKCPSCGEIYFADPVNLNPCTKCGKANTFFAYIKTPRYNVALHQRTKLYLCHTDKESEDFQSLTGETTLNNGNFELKNLSGKNWSVIESKNTTALGHNGIAVLKKGIEIDFGGTIAQIV
ncbi:protein kinase domain-containing protein [Treponema primitia]|uniref:protein kinase domain-containing protein n=1 Tax=Treponema primitia TaxID=88058 RepID=UPI0002554E62|nr:hypothetical protein [Treponema primitia]